MKITLLIATIFVTLAGYSQSGDKDLDVTLLSLNKEAKAGFISFKLELSKTYSVSASKIDYLNAEIGMSGGDIYMTLEIARITRRSIDSIVTVYKANKTKGWGVMAKELGIKPGSPEFHQLKGNAKSKGKGGGKGKGKGKGKGSGIGN